MSDQETPAAGGDPRAFDAVKRQARQLLRQAQAGDVVVLGVLRGLLPRLAAMDDATASASIKLADVQHAIARRMGHANWAAVKAMYSRLDPLHTQAARFLTALSDGDLTQAQAVLTATPAVAHYSIHTAAAVGDADYVEQLLATDPALATQLLPTTPYEPLLYAVQEELKRALHVSSATQVALVRALLDAGASPNASAPLPDVSDRIPALYFPCAAGHVAVARLLLERGAHPTDGESLYHAAQHDRRECLELLESFGADLSHGPTPDGNTPLHFLAAHTADNSLAPTVMRGLTWLLEHGADPNVVSYPGRTDRTQAGEVPLHRLAAGGYGEENLSVLIRHGANPDARRDDGVTAYQLAVRAGNTGAATYLASIGADTTLSDVDQLLEACLANDAARAQALVTAHPELMATLNSELQDALRSAVQQGRADTVRLMLSLGWPMTGESEWGGTPLHWAAWNGEVDMVRLLLEFGAPVNQRDSRYGSSPIAWAAHGSRFCDRANDEDYPAIVNLLLDAGATRPESYNYWNEAPERLARPSVVQVFKVRGFAV